MAVGSPKVRKTLRVTWLQRVPFAAVSLGTSDAADTPPRYLTPDEYEGRTENL